MGKAASAQLGVSCRGLFARRVTDLMPMMQLHGKLSEPKKLLGLLKDTAEWRRKRTAEWRRFPAGGFEGSKQMDLVEGLRKLAILS